jgi:sortase A
MSLERKNIRPIRILALFMGLTGIGLIIFVTAPIVSYEITSRQKYPKLESPVPAQSIGEVLNKDYKNPNNWFTAKIEAKDNPSEIKSYLISIPKLKIKDAQVLIGGEDLSKSLIQIPGTAEPGRVGNSVIFGHSVLPAFFNPANYLTIFSTLPKLKVGDEIIINSDGIIYKYVISDMFEVTPANIQILEQNSDTSYISLVTCVPPGHPLKPRRLVIRAKIHSYASGF